MLLTSDKARWAERHAETSASPVCDGCGDTADWMEMDDRGEWWCQWCLEEVELAEQELRAQALASAEA